MTRTRKMIVGFVATLSLLGAGGVAAANAASEQGSVDTAGWCC